MTTTSKSTITNPSKITYKHCPTCNSVIATTAKNPDGKCHYAGCKSFGFNGLGLISFREDSAKPKELTPEDNHYIELNDKYLGKQTYVHELGEVLTCLRVLYPDNLFAVSQLKQGAYILSEEEFQNAIDTGHLTGEQS